MKKIFYFQRIPINPHGNGGQHRSYQIYFDLTAAFGAENVIIIDLTKCERIKEAPLKVYIRELIMRWKLLVDLLVKKLSPQKISKASIRQIIAQQEINHSYLSMYRLALQQYGQPEFCVIDHPEFIEVATYNFENHIRTILCPQNLEVFVNVVGNGTNEDVIYKAAVNFVKELLVFAFCDDHFIISKNELSLVRGLGYNAKYYPYLPVGEIKDWLLNIRTQRTKGAIVKGLFVYIGTISYGPTLVGIKWLLSKIREEGLPEGCQIIIAGNGGKNLIDEYGSISNIQIFDRLEQSEMENLLIKAQAVLVPQFAGFGSVTRITEMACAGIPVLASEHSVSAMDVPPGVVGLPQQWSDWKEAILKLEARKNDEYTNIGDSYDVWEHGQTNPFFNLEL